MSPQDRIAELEEIVLQLRAELRLEPERQHTMALQAAYRLTRSEAIVLSTLYGAGSAWLSQERLLRSLPSRDVEDGRDAHIVGVFVHRIRSKLGQDSVLSYPYRGYTIGSAGIAACAAVAPT